MTEEQYRICLLAINTYGVEHQKRKCLEELGELIAEIAREHEDRGGADRVREELADVIVMCEQMRIIYGGSLTDEWIQRKLERLRNRIHGLTEGGSGP